MPRKDHEERRSKYEKDTALLMNAHAQQTLAVASASETARKVRSTRSSARKPIPRRGRIVAARGVIAQCAAHAKDTDVPS